MIILLQVAAKNKRRTTVANISAILGSITAIDDFKDFLCLPYLVSKTSLNMITKCLSIELGADNIRALAIHPGHVQTDMGGPNTAIDATASAQGILTLIKNINDNNFGTLTIQHY